MIRTTDVHGACHHEPRLILISLISSIVLRANCRIDENLEATRVSCGCVRIAHEIRNNFKVCATSTTTCHGNH